MLPSGRWTTVGRILLSATAVVIYAALPEALSAAPSARQTILLAGAAVLAPLWIAFWWWAIDRAVPAAAPIAVTLITLVLAGLTAAAPPGRDGLLLAALAGGAAFEARRSAPVVVAIGLLAGAIQVLHGTPPLAAGGTAVNDLVVGAAAIAGRLLLITNDELTRARDEVARLAVSEERLRFARDLHDLLGHDLTLAVMKAELAARDLPADTPPPVRELVADVAAAIRQALDDVRSAASGLRRLDLATELASARAALAAAGVELVVERGVDALPPMQENTLAWVLRESVTNVLRHSRAHRCVIRLARGDEGAVLEVEDDGAGAGGAQLGGGLAGIAERVAALGGSFAASEPDGRGYRVRASVPLPPS